MGMIRKALTKWVAKGLTVQRQEQQAQTWGMLLRQTLFGGKNEAPIYDPRQDAIRLNSAAASVAAFYARNGPQARLEIYDKESQETDSPALEAAKMVLELFSNGSPRTDGRIFWHQVYTDLVFHGNSFHQIVRGDLLAPTHLRWLNPLHVLPATSQATAAYDTKAEGWSVSGAEEGSTILPAEDVLHLRWGANPAEPVMGLSPLAAAIGEVCTDSESANYTFTVLKNLGLVGIAVAPDPAAPEVTEEPFKKMRDTFEERFTGNERGKALISSIPIKIQPIEARALAGADLTAIRNISEERITALGGVPAAVVGLGTGLQQTKVGATMREMVFLAWNGGIIPLQDMIAMQLEVLLPEYGADPAQIGFRFDRSQVGALQETPEQKANRLVMASGGEYMSRAEARAEAGLPEMTPEEEEAAFGSNAPQPQLNPFTQPETEPDPEQLDSGN